MFTKQQIQDIIKGRGKRKKSLNMRTSKYKILGERLFIIIQG